VCSSQKVSYLCDTHNHHSQTKIINHYRCNDCGSVFVGNKINGDELGIAYSTLDSDGYYAEIEAENRKKMVTAITDLKDLISPQDHIIDLGTGNGMFIEMLIANGFENVSAHEIPGCDLSFIEKTAKHIFQDFDYSTIPSETFDAVTLLDVLEHVPDPKYLIETCARILKKDGVIYIHTPVVTKTDRLMHFLQRVPVLKKAGTMWQSARTSIFHLENYTDRSLRGLLRAAGFYDIDIEVKNELSWNASRYVRIYLLDKLKLPGSLSPVVTPFFYPLMATNFFNANKAIVSARKAQSNA
jgi:2-polyprenyl-3-methyl-5-hydroxy-6-metoxy-1,4-benzoquinol methylase